MIEFERFTHLTFDCYGTLVDWEAGILAATAPVLARHGLSVPGARILEIYNRIEAAEESGDYKPYREILRSVMSAIAAEVGFDPTAEDLNALAGSVGSWPPFPDTVDALRRLGRRYELVILSNIDDAFFALTAKLLGVEFSQIITAQQVGSYKPAQRNFQVALQRLGTPIEQVLHVAQSLYHDHIPAKALGFTTIWINRKGSRLGVTEIPPESRPDLELPDMRSLAERSGL